MSIQKQCADFLRSTYRNLANGKLGSGHAHEIVAAYFGYGSAAALQAERQYLLSSLDQAEFLIPDLGQLRRRIPQLTGLPQGLPGAPELAEQITEFLTDRRLFPGAVWQRDNLEDSINIFIQENASLVEDGLSGEIAETNAYFDDLNIDEVDCSFRNDALVAELSGKLNGENDPDRPYSGTSIVFTSLVTFPRVAGRFGYGSPEVETSGSINPLH
jgi:hypothetical protein